MSSPETDAAPPRAKTNEPEAGTPEFWAKIRPDAPAVVMGDAVMTYGDWNAKADRAAAGLAALGLGPGDRLGMRFRLCFEWFIAQRALQKLGVAQVAVNWRLEPDEARYILGDSGAKGLVCDDSDPTRWAAQGLDVLVTVGQEHGSTAGIRLEDLVETPDVTPRFGPLRPIMILYTSGTTGAPRGVPPHDHSGIDRKRLRRYLTSVDGMPPRTGAVSWLLTLPVHHGAGPLAAAAACAAGGTVVLLDPYDAQDALRLIEKHRVEVWTAVTTMLLRIQRLPDEVFRRYDLSSLKVLGTGAAPVPQSLKQWIFEQLGSGLVWEGYGVSEAGMICCAAPEHHLSKPGTSGLPYDGVELAIVDEDWNRLPAGATGEIAVNTPAVLKHYLGHEPLGEDTIKDGFYRTGDVGHLDEDGFLFITDRKKDMIVAGGVNLYPAEIEAALVAHPDVVEAAVIGIPQETFGEQPLAFVLTKETSDLSEADLADFLEGRLASYKRPRRYRFVDDLPHNPMGKVLKNELRRPFWEGRDRAV
jgi:long-chain acyl-CoA synthetase